MVHGPAAHDAARRREAGRAGAITDFCREQVLYHRRAPGPNLLDTSTPPLDTSTSPADGQPVTSPANTDGGKQMSVEAPETQTAVEPPPTQSGVRSRSAWLLAVCCVAQFMVILDLSIVNVALPSIQSSLGFSLGRPAVGRRRVRDHVRRLPDARRPRGRPVRPAPDVRRRAGRCSRWRRSPAAPRRAGGC